MEAKFVLSKNKLKDQVEILENLGFKISYSYKTNHEVGKVLQSEDFGKNVDFSIHAKEEILDISDKKKIWFFLQAESKEEMKNIFSEGIRNFVIDNEIDLENLLEVAEESKIKLTISLRMKFQEHRVGTGKYFVYGMPSKEINDLILKLKGNNNLDKIGVHIHRKSQNTSEWEIKSELEDSLSDETLEVVDFVNFGGGLPIEYKSYSASTMNYILNKLLEAREFLEIHDIKSYIEPGRFLAGPSVKLITEIIQVQGSTLVLNTTIYQCALDTVLTGTKMIVEEETSENSDDVGFYLLKGNSPTRDDIFRYRVGLPIKKARVGGRVVFLNAGAYNYTTDFFGYHKLKTEFVE
jgi:ornithine decarboxylase